MKGLQGLAIAVAMGVVGAVCNWFYISQKARELDKVDFVYIKAEARINAGDKFKESHFGKLSIPQKYLGNLERIGVRWEDRDSAVGETAHKSYGGNELLLQADLLTPPRKGLASRLSAGESTYAVQVDATTFIAANFNPGDSISFYPPADVSVKSGANDSQDSDLVGPFRILAIGGRQGSRAVEKAAGIRSSRENIITVALKRGEKNHRELERIVRMSRGKGVRVALESDQEPAKKKP